MRRRLSILTFIGSLSITIGCTSSSFRREITEPLLYQKNIVKAVDVLAREGFLNGDKELIKNYFDRNPKNGNLDRRELSLLFRTAESFEEYKY